MNATLLDELADELGAITGRIERDQRLRLDAVIADLRRIDAERELRLVNLERLVRDRLATIKDGEPGRSVTVEDVAPLVATEVARQVATIEVPRGEPGEPGKSVELSDVVPVIAEEIARQVAAIPAPEPGKSVTIEDVRPMLQSMVDAIEVPRGEPGEPGRSVELSDVVPVIAEEIARQVAAIPAPEPGKSVTIEDVRPILQAMVDAIEVPRGEPGEPGRSVELSDVVPVIVEEIARQVAAIPAAEPGKSVTVEDVRPLLQAMVDAIEVPRGEPGKPGERGPEGRLSVAKTWNDRVHYEGEVVTHQNSTWQALRDTGREPPHDDWICLAAAGQNGRDGRSPRVRDTFDAKVDDYRELDIVMLNGAAFIARRDNPGQCPGDGWKLIAMQGKSGKPGEKGVGIRGPAGPGVAALEVTDQGLLTLTNGDGSKVELDLYPLLSKLQG